MRFKSVGRHVLTAYRGMHRAGFHVVVTTPAGDRAYDVTRQPFPFRWNAAECVAQGHTPADHLDPSEVR